MMKKILYFTVALVIIFNLSLAFAGDARAPRTPVARTLDRMESTAEGPLNLGFKEIGFYSGYMDGDLEQKGNYQVIPLMLRLGYDLRPLLNNKSNILLEFLLEPFINVVYEPDSNIESGCNFLFKFAYPLTDKIYPYFEGGVGMIHLTQQTIEQSTQFNFTQHLGGGITYFLKNDLALSLGYRYRHLSNASIKKPNSGIDTNSIICGVSLFY